VEDKLLRKYVILSGSAIGGIRANNEYMGLRTLLKNLKFDQQNICEK
jgi:hypothetical protein